MTVIDSCSVRSGVAAPDKGSTAVIAHAAAVAPAKAPTIAADCIPPEAAAGASLDDQRLGNRIGGTDVADWVGHNRGEESGGRHGGSCTSDNKWTRHSAFSYSVFDLRRHPNAARRPHKCRGKLNAQ